MNHRSACSGSGMSPPMKRSKALFRAPEKLKDWYGPARGFSFANEVMPVLDKYCVECHNPDRYEGRVNLCGDHLPMWSISYVTLFRLGLVSDGGNKPISNRDPRTIGSSASKLLKYLDGSHYDAKLTDHERKVVRLWIDGSANWAGTYACLGNPEYHVSWGALPQRCAGCHKKRNRFKLGVNRVLCNLDWREKSLIIN